MKPLNLVQRTIYWCIMPKDIRLSLKVSCEGVYRVFYGNYEIINTRQNREIIIGEVIKYPDVFTAEFQMRFD